MTETQTLAQKVASLRDGQWVRAVSETDGRVGAVVGEVWTGMSYVNVGLCAVGIRGGGGVTPTPNLRALDLDVEPVTLPPPPIEDGVWLVEYVGENIYVEHRDGVWRWKSVDTPLRWAVLPLQRIGDLPTEGASA